MSSTLEKRQRILEDTLNGTTFKGYASRIKLNPNFVERLETVAFSKRYMPLRLYWRVVDKATRLFKRLKTRS